MKKKTYTEQYCEFKLKQEQQKITKKLKRREWWSKHGDKFFYFPIIIVVGLFFIWALCGLIFFLGSLCWQDEMKKFVRENAPVVHTYYPEPSSWTTNREVEYTNVYFYNNTLYNNYK